MFKKIQKYAGEVLEFSSDVLDNGPKIIVMGRTEIIVEYFQGVAFVSNEEIILNTSQGDLSLQGKDFVLIEVMETQLHIKGRINQLSFKEG